MQDFLQTGWPSCERNKCQSIEESQNTVYQNKIKNRFVSSDSFRDKAVTSSKLFVSLFNNFGIFTAESVAMKMSHFSILKTN